MGDFNAQPFSIPIALMRNHALLTDTFLETHPEADDLNPLPTSPEIAIIANGMSCDSPLNSWSAAKSIPPNIQAQGGKRLDYILYRQPEPRRKRRRNVSQQDGLPDGTGGFESKREDESDDDIPQLRCVKCELVLTDPVPGESFSYSDHSGLFATFEITSSPDRTSNPFSTTGHRSMKDKRSSTPDPAWPYHQPSPSGSTYAPDLSRSDLIRRALGTITAYSTLSRRAASRHMLVSLACMVLLLALAVASAWQPKSYIQPVFTIVAALLGAAGVTFFYLGWIWGKWEAGILGEIEQEMESELHLILRENQGQQP